MKIRLMMMSKKDKIMHLVELILSLVFVTTTCVSPVNALPGCSKGNMVEAKWPAGDSELVWYK